MDCTLEYLSGLLGGSGGHGHRKKKRKQLQTVELKVRMDCEGCELKVKSALSSLKGVPSVDINRKRQKVTVEASKVLKKARSTGKKAEIWPYVPHNMVSQPYVAGTYDEDSWLLRTSEAQSLATRPAPSRSAGRTSRSPTCSATRTQTPARSCEKNICKYILHLPSIIIA